MSAARPSSLTRPWKVGISAGLYPFVGLDFVAGFVEAALRILPRRDDPPERPGGAGQAAAQVWMSINERQERLDELVVLVGGEDQHARPARRLAHLPHPRHRIQPRHHHVHQHDVDVRVVRIGTDGLVSHFPLPIHDAAADVAPTVRDAGGTPTAVPATGASTPMS